MYNFILLNYVCVNTYKGKKIKEVKSAIIVQL